MNIIKYLCPALFLFQSVFAQEDSGLFKMDLSIFDGRILFWGSIILTGIAVAIITITFFNEESEFQVAEKIEEVGEKAKGSKEEFLIKYTRPFFRRYFTPIVQSMKKKKQIREKYKRPLASAGLTNSITPEDFYAMKLFLIIGFPILFLGLRAFLEEQWPLSIIPILSVVGFIFPDKWLESKALRRNQEINRAMPFCVDMMALSVEAGLDYIAAMTKVAEKANPSPLVDEFEIVIKDLRVGASRSEALRNMAWRVDMIQISSFVATLIAADSVGASIPDILKKLSKEIREKRSADAEKAGATAATKIIFPMMFLIAPAVFIVIAAPMAVDMINSGAQ